MGARYYITVKVKTLVIIFAGILAAAVALYGLVPQWLFHTGRYDSVMRYFPHSSYALDALYWDSQKVDPTLEMSRLIYTFGADESGGGYDLSLTTADISRAMRDLEQFIARSQSAMNSRTGSSSGSSNDTVGGSDSLLQNARWNLALVNIQAGNYGVAREMLSAIAARQGSFQNAAAKLLQGIQDAHQSRVLNKNVGAVSGQIKFGKTAARRVYVFVRPMAQANVFYSNPFQFFSGGFTDASGHFFIRNLPPGNYELGIGVTPTQVSGYFWPGSKKKYLHVSAGETTHSEVQLVPLVRVVSPANGLMIEGKNLRFRWKAYPGASFYRVNVTSIDRGKTGFSATTAPLPGDWKGTSADYSLQTLRERAPGPTKDSEHGLVPSSILGEVYPGGDFSWSVEAFAPNGALLSSSRGYYFALSSSFKGLPFFTVSAAGQTSGDKLVLRYQYRAAKIAYLKDGANPNALRALARMAFFGIGIHDNGNPKLALTYLRRIRKPDAIDKTFIRQVEKAISSNKRG